mgnify:CR=1 FL=1
MKSCESSSCVRAYKRYVAVRLSCSALQKTKSVRRQEFYGVVLQKMLLEIRRAIHKKVPMRVVQFLCRATPTLACMGAQACSRHFVKQLHYERFGDQEFESECVCLDLDAVYGSPTWRGEPLGARIKLPYSRKVVEDAARYYNPPTGKISKFKEVGFEGCPCIDEDGDRVRPRHKPLCMYGL